MEVVVIALMLFINAVFASYEMALAAVSRARLEVLLKAGQRGAQCAVYMKDRMEGSLAVIQLGITLAGAIAAATGGAGVGDYLSPWLMRTLKISEAASEVLGLLIFVIPLSAITIVFAELVPKMIGINNKEGVALALSPLMKRVSQVFHPVVFVFELAVKKLMRMGGKRWAAKNAQQDRAGLLELRAATTLARATRIIGPMEERIVLSAVQLSARTVTDAMVPARDIATIAASMSLSEALISAHINNHTRYPVCEVEGDPQSISGYVMFKDIVMALKIDLTGAGLRGIVRPIRRMESSTTLAQALTDMIRERVHITLVTKDAVVLGMVTMEDVVEELVGDIHDEYDRLPTHVHPIGEGWIVGGGVARSLARTMGAAVFPGADAKWTLADWVDRVRNVSARSDDTIRAGGVDVLVRKVRRNRVAEAVVHKADAAAGIEPGRTPLTP